MKRIPALLFPLLLAVSGCHVVGTTTCKPSPPLTDARRAEHLKSFDYIWQTIHDRHYDPTFGGVCWNAVRAELRPKVETAKDDREAEAVLSDLVHRLKLSHFGILPPNRPPATESKGTDAFVPPLARDTQPSRVNFGHLTNLPLRVTHRRLSDGDVGYFYVSMFLEPAKVMPAFRRAVADARDARGLIIDLRHNAGGLGTMAVGMANALVDKPGLKLGTMIQREGNLNFVLNPQAEPYAGPVAVLIDHRSASTAEIFAQGMQDLGRARVFGTTSAGQALPSYLETLPNGYLFQYAVANYTSSGGKTLEGNGVTPDVVVENPKPDDTIDPVVQAAIAWIQLQSEKKQQ